MRQHSLISFIRTSDICTVIASSSTPTLTRRTLFDRRISVENGLFSATYLRCIVVFRRVKPYRSTDMATSCHFSAVPRMHEMG